jgi:hypothetical protein
MIVIDEKFLVIKEINGYLVVMILINSFRSGRQYVWTPILDSNYYIDTLLWTSTIWTQNMGPQYGPPLWTPILDPHFGPILWTPNMDSQYGPPILTLNMNHQYVWTPILDSNHYIDTF